MNVGREAGSGGDIVVVRAPALQRWLLPTSYAGLVIWAALGVRTDGPRVLLALALFGGFGVVTATDAVRGRIEIQGREVRIVRAFSEDLLARDEIDHLARSGGRGKPAHLALIEGASRPRKVLALDRRPGLRTIEARGIGLPIAMTAAQAARALGVPLTAYSGEEPRPRTSAQVDLQDWQRRPFIWACAVVSGIGVGLTIWGLFLLPSAG